MNRYRVIVVDDEPAARDGLAVLLAKDSQIELVDKCANGLEAINSIEKFRPDFVLLDIQMPEVSGFDVLAALTPPLPVVVFVTAYDQFAIKAFEHHALDYLLKPFTDKRFQESITRAKKAIDEAQKISLNEKLFDLLKNQTATADRFFNAPKASLNRKLAVKASGKILLISFDDIEFIEADDYVVNVHYQNKVAVIRESMKNLETLLPTTDFIRTHKSFIVNVHKVAEVESDVGGGLILNLKGKQTVSVSKNYREAVVSALGLER